MRKDTKKLLVGGGVVALLAAIFWPKKPTGTGAAATAPVSKPPLPTTPPTPTKSGDYYPGGSIPGQYVWKGLWLWEDGGWSLVAQDGPYPYPADIGHALPYAWPMFEQATSYAPPYYYAAGYHWTGSGWTLEAEECNRERGATKTWCGR